MFYFFTKQATVMRRSTVPNLPLQLVFPGNRIDSVYYRATQKAEVNSYFRRRHYASYSKTMFVGLNQVFY